MPTSREIELEQKLRAEKDRADVLAAWLARYVVDYSVEHLKDCPEDDTCECPHVRYINKILEGSQTVEDKDDPSYLRGQLALAERDRSAMNEERRKEHLRRLALESAVHQHLEADLLEDETAVIARFGREHAEQSAEIRRLNEVVARLTGELDHAERTMRSMNDNARGVLDALRDRLSSALKS